MTISALHGDGVNFEFFNLLWSKSSNNANETTNISPTLCIPDTVIFMFGLPHQWYFTSKNGGPGKDQAMILRKKPNSLTLANIEKVFLDKANTGTRRGDVGEEDVVAYFIQSQPNDEDGVVDQHCNIQYFTKKSLHKFLQHGRNNKSGILQRFIAPHGGGTHNSQIRAIWTPKLCVLERRRTKQNLHDTRFAPYERCITFDGPDVHSVSVPLRGCVLSGRVENICNEIVRHIADVSSDNTTKGDTSFTNKMVVNFKVGGNGSELA